jgi:hypothetical protein
MTINYQKIAAGIIRIQSIGILAFAVITLYGALTTREIDNWSTLIVEIFIYAVFVVVMWLIALGIVRNNNRAFGPFVLTQLFVIILAWPLATEGEIATRALGVVAGLSALIALYLVFSKKFRTEFFEN